MEENKLWEPIVFVDDPIDIAMNTILNKMELSLLRKSFKMTQKDVSNATGLSIQCISDIESINGGNPTLKSLIRYLNCFGYDLKFVKKNA